MTRSPPTWFGFTLSPKQAISLFVLALFGVLICIFVFIMSGVSIYMDFYYNNLYYDPYYIVEDSSYFTYMLISQLLPSIFFFVIFIICCYTISMCKQTAKYYNQRNNYPQPQPRTYTPRSPQRKNTEIKPTYNEMMFCPNCGTKHGESHQFCINCGYEII